MQPSGFETFAGEIQFVSHPGQIGQRSRPHLAHDLGTMDFTVISLTPIS
jgi:hypothetical protein